VPKDIPFKSSRNVAPNDIPDELIPNWDQTGINLVPGASWTMDKRREKQIDISGFKDKRQITAIMFGNFMGEVLLPQLIYEGKTDKCCTPLDFPHNWLINHSVKHWSNEGTMLECL